MNNNDSQSPIQERINELTGITAIENNDNEHAIIKKQLTNYHQLLQIY